MDWNAKTTLQWDWENLALFGGKESELSRPAQQHEWNVEGAGGLGDATLYSSSRGACSGSELGNGSSRSSISASMCSSSKATIKVPEFEFKAVEGFPKDLSKSKELARGEDTGTSPVAMARVPPGEPPIGLKLGKRTYFEDICTGNSVKNPSASSVMPSTSLVKRTRVSRQSMQTTYCQVEGCNIDLTTAKDYHCKHRVCENHSKSSKVIVAGQECRFCQQCSRFHDLSEFDQKKRSCRRRLSDHNARRRKPQPKIISFNSSRLSPSFYGLGASVVASSLDRAQDLRRALSLLSNDSWCSAESGAISHTQFVSINNSTAAHPAMHAVDTSPGFWQDAQPVALHTRVLPFDLQSHSGQFQEIQLHEATLFDSSQMH